VVAAAGIQIDQVHLLKITPLIQERIKTLNDVLSVADFFFAEELPPYDPAELIPKKGDAAMALKALESARRILETAEFTHDGLDSVLRAEASALRIKTGQMFQPIRVAVCGRMVSPPLFGTLEVLGRAICLKRIDQAIQALLAQREASDQAILTSQETLKALAVLAGLLVGGWLIFLSGAFGVAAMQDIWTFWRTIPTAAIAWRDLLHVPYSLAATTLVPATLSMLAFGLMVLAKTTAEPARVVPEIYMTFVKEEVGGTQASGIILILGTVAGVIAGLIWGT